MNVYVPWNIQVLDIFFNFMKRAVDACMWPAVLVFAMLVTPGLVVKLCKYFDGKIG